MTATASNIVTRGTKLLKSNDGFVTAYEAWEAAAEQGARFDGAAMQYAIQ
jgi:hypothetical protein